MDSAAPFDPDFDDCAWTDAWANIPIVQVVPGDYGSFSVKAWRVDEADVCGRHIALSPPLEVRGLVHAEGRLWMSDAPQERLMMFNNAQASHGRTLVGGLGLGLYAQYAMPYVSELVIVERDARLVEAVEPVVRVAAAAHGVPLRVHTCEVGDVLCAPPDERYDTIFLDTWSELDAAHLPGINALRGDALPHLAPGGRVLLWGYGWMLRLFLDACERLLAVEPGGRRAWLRVMTRQRPAVWRMLVPVLEHFAGDPVDHMAPALDWCRAYAIDLTPGALPPANDLDPR
jgi:hypothetical protein